MTDPERHGALYVAFAAESDEPNLVPDVVYDGRQVAAVRSLNGESIVTFYHPLGAEGCSVPLHGVREALAEAASRLGDP